MTLNRSLRKITWKVCILPLLAGLLPGMGKAQVETVKAAIPTIEPGLELVVKWPWQVQASDAATWGIPVDVPEETVTVRPGIPVPQAEAKKAPAKVAPKGPPPQMIEHTVAKGDSLTKIAHANGVTIDQLRIFNEMKNDRIVIGQIVKVPGEPDIAAMIAAAAEAEKEAAKNKPKGKEAAEPKKKPTPAKEEAPPVLIATKPHRALPPAAWGASSLVLIQAYLDRQGFTIGPIDGTAGPMYDAAYKSFEKAYPGQLHTPEGQPSVAMRSIGGPYVEYTLTAADMRWISPHGSAPAGGKAKGAKAVEPPPTFEELTKEPFMAYRSGWEFVAEKFHAAESFLRHINPGVKNPNVPGAIFLVPNVLPFEIEKAFEEPLQPAADPAAPVSASVVGFNRLIIHKGEKIVANMPLSAARPGLRGRKTWKILDVIPRPAMASTGDPAAPMTVPYRLHAGPNNPVGILWINLAKGGDPKVLPYGLHGTSIPGAMTKQESIGGFRMTNWDIARVVRMLPAGTDLKWE